MFQSLSLFAAAIGLTALAASSAKAAELDLGAELPSVIVPDQDANATDLGAAGAAGYTLVYFYPKADTAGCTKQACSLRDAFEQLTTHGVRVFGVSGDDVAAQKAFAEKYKLPFRLLADTEAKVMDAFGVPRRGTYASRQAFLFQDGKLVWRDLSASTAEQAADVLAFLDGR